LAAAFPQSKAATPYKALAQDTLLVVSASANLRSPLKC
jgi:hypothetical protein